MTIDATYPRPAVNDTNRPMLAAWQQGELHLQRCEDCGQVSVLPRTLCPVCWSTRLTWQRRTGHGRVVTAAAVCSHVTPPFSDESPVVFCEIALDEGGVMLARVVGVDESAVRPGCEVELVTMPEAGRYPLPTFRVRPIDTSATA